MKRSHIIATGITLALLVAIILTMMFYLPKYQVYRKELRGKANLIEAQQDRQILIEEAQSRLEAEKLNAQAEVERAKGMAQAMEIESGKLTETYNQYLFIRSLEDLADKGDLPQIIYIPHQGMVPTFGLKDHQ